MSLTVSANLSLSKNGLVETFFQTQTASSNSAGYIAQSPVLGTASSAINTATLETAGYAFLRSLVTTTQATCTITFGKLDGTTMHDIAVLRPGEPALLRLAAGGYAAKAADEGYRLFFAAVEE